MRAGSHCSLLAEIAYYCGYCDQAHLNRDFREFAWTSPSAYVGHVVVADPDAHHQRAKAAGAQIIKELEDQDYGSRDYSARDLEGNLWSFGTYDPSNPAASAGAEACSSDPSNPAASAGAEA